MDGVNMLDLPKEWSDDQTMNVLFSPFRDNRSVNPKSWDGKLKFWSDLIFSYCKSSGTVMLTEPDICSFFIRKGKLPQCINTVFQENLRARKYVTVSEFTTAAPDSWFRWGVHWMIKKPTTWTLNTFVKAPLLWTYAKLVSSLADNLIKTQPVVICEVVQELSKSLFSRYQAQVASETTDCIVGYDVLFERNKDLVKNMENFHLVIIQLVKDKKCILFETETNQKVVRFIKSNKRSITPPNDCDNKIYKLVTAESTLQEQICKLDAETTRLQSEAKMHIKAGSRTMAKNSLRRKRQVEAIKSQKESALTNVQQLITVIQHADTNKMVLDAYSSGSEVFKQLSKQSGLTPEKVDDIMTDMEETFEMHEDLNQSLMANTTATDDFSMAELEDELSQILKEGNPTGDREMAEGGPTQPSVEQLENISLLLPKVPTFVPSTPQADEKSVQHGYTLKDKTPSPWS